jgi:four helix bundle protein
MLKSYKDLDVWKKAYKFCLDIYRATKLFPDEERYGLASQMRRAAVSIPCNIAEGYGRKTNKEYIQLLYIAYGSACELETQTMLVKDLGYVNYELFTHLQQDFKDIERMLKALIKSLERST